MTIVDSHLHVNYYGLSLENLIKYLDRGRIDYCWLLTWEEINPGLWPYQHLSIENVYQAYLKYPSRIIPFYAPDPHKNDASTQLEDWYAKGIRGYGELKATLNWESDEVKRILQTVRKLKLPIVFHMEESEFRYVPYSNAIYDKIVYYGLKTERKLFQIPKKVLQMLVKNYAPLKGRTKSYVFPGYMFDFASLEMTIKEFPDIIFVAHGPEFWKYMYDDADLLIQPNPNGQVYGEGIIWRLLKEYSNLYADISGDSGFNALNRNANNAKKFLSMFEDKILYATDNVMKKQREFVDSLSLRENTYKKIYGENACRIVRL